MNKSMIKSTKTAVIMSVYKNDCLEKIKQSIDSIVCQLVDIYVHIDGPIQTEVNKWLYNSLNTQITYISEGVVNKGLAYSMNELLRIVLSRGYQYIARMDADDISMCNRFKKQIAFLDVHLEVDCLGTWAIEIDADGNEYFKKQMPTTHAECLQLFKKRDCMIHPTVMYRRTFFDKAGLYPEDTYFGEDTMMWANGFKSGCQFANLPEYLLKFRLDENFFNRRRGIRHAISIYILRKKVLGFGIKEDICACLYALAKMMPACILKIIYKMVR